MEVLKWMYFPIVQYNSKTSVLENIVIPVNTYIKQSNNRYVFNATNLTS